MTLLATAGGSARQARIEATELCVHSFPRVVSRFVATLGFQRAAVAAKSERRFAQCVAAQELGFELKKGDMHAQSIIRVTDHRRSGACGSCDGAAL
jgi:hypothetical protein